MPARAYPQDPTAFLSLQCYLCWAFEDQHQMRKRLQMLLKEKAKFHGEDVHSQQSTGKRVLERQEQPQEAHRMHTGDMLSGSADTGPANTSTVAKAYSELSTSVRKGGFYCQEQTFREAVGKGVQQAYGT